MLIIDLESTCWKLAPPEGEISEIIEIGVCQFDFTNRVPLNPRGVLVRPTRSRLSAFCTKLTTLTQEEVDAGVSFAEACERLKQDYQSDTSVWASWGAYDEQMFRAQCALFDVPYPFSQHHINLKAVFAEHFNKGRRVGMMRAMKMLGVTPEGTHHRGVDDAWNTARLLGVMLQQAGEGLLALEPANTTEPGTNQ